MLYIDVGDFGEICEIGELHESNENTRVTRVTNQYYQCVTISIFEKIIPLRTAHDALHPLIYRRDSDSRRAILF